MSLDAQRSWMYSGWKDNGRHSNEWIQNTNAFVNHVLRVSVVPSLEFLVLAQNVAMVVGEQNNR